MYVCEVLEINGVCFLVNMLCPKKLNVPVLQIGCSSFAEQTGCSSLQNRTVQFWHIEHMFLLL
jgi:hypothetical protein